MEMAIELETVQRKATAMLTAERQEGNGAKGVVSVVDNAWHDDLMLEFVREQDDPVVTPLHYATPSLGRSFPIFGRAGGPSSSAGGALSHSHAVLARAFASHYRTCDEGPLPSRLSLRPPLLTLPAPPPSPSCSPPWQVAL